LDPNPDTALDAWFGAALGQSVLGIEAALVRRALDDVFGFEFLQLGVWGRGPALLAGARMPHATLVAPHAGSGVTLCAPLDMLPFASDSIDAILLPHTLELVEDPYGIVREAERVLCAEGCLLVCGFNPLSGWGVRRLMARALGRGVFPPQIRRLLTERRLRDWVAVLGFDVDQVSGYLSPLPFAANPAGEGRERSALAAGAYLLKARKRVQTLTPVRKKSWARQRVLIGAAEPTTNVQR
jgi:SAM-dependent methyltransferase